MSDPSFALPAKDLDSARSQFIHLYGSTAVMNTYLKIAVLCLCAVCVALALLNIKTYQLLRDVKPIVIRINDVGRAEAVSSESLEYHPQEAEIKYFLSQFVREHYGRMRATVQDNFAHSLYFLDGRLADSIMETNKKTKAIETFMAGQGEEVDINVKNVSIEDLRHSPFRATVDFERIYYQPEEHIETKREKSVANFVFSFNDHISNAMVPINPLGLEISYFREDRAFE